MIQTQSVWNKALKFAPDWTLCLIVGGKIQQNRSKIKFCLINNLTTFSQYFYDIFTIFSLHHVSHLCQESWFAQSNNNIFTTDDIFTIFSRLMIFSGHFQDIFTTFSRRLEFVICIISVFCIQSHESWKHRENIMKISSTRGTLKTFENTRSK